jgi:hypothetical protein
MIVNFTEINGITAYRTETALSFVTDMRCMLYEEAVKMPKRTRQLLGILLGINIALLASAVIMELFMEGDYGFTNWTFSIVLVVLFYALLTSKMAVSLTSETLMIRSGVAKRIVQVSNIRKVRIETYDRSKATRWTGYGYGAKYNGTRSYIGGDSGRGIWFELYCGDPFMVSSETPEQFESAIRALIGDEGRERQ